VRLHARCVEFLNYAHALIGHTADLFDGSLEAPELALQVFHGRLEAITELPATVGKEEIACGAANESANQCACRHCRPFVHASS
jgi:hypothetical protein